MTLNSCELTTAMNLPIICWSLLFLITLKALLIVASNWVAYWILGGCYKCMSSLLKFMVGISIIPIVKQTINFLLILHTKWYRFGSCSGGFLSNANGFIINFKVCQEATQVLAWHSRIVTWFNNLMFLSWFRAEHRTGFASTEREDEPEWASQEGGECNILRILRIIPLTLILPSPEFPLPSI